MGALFLDCIGFLCVLGFEGLCGYAMVVCDGLLCVLGSEDSRRYVIRP